LGILHFKKMDPKPDLSFLFWHQTAKWPSQSVGKRKVSLNYPALQTCVGRNQCSSRLSDFSLQLSLQSDKEIALDGTERKGVEGLERRRIK
jgi:hypothetical protein